jgi:hypothetical protein
MLVKKQDQQEEQEPMKHYNGDRILDPLHPAAAPLLMPTKSCLHPLFRCNLLHIRQK